MYLTESEAKGKWCPQARQTDDALSTYNRDACGQENNGCFCLASSCMMWRWKDKDTEFSVNRYREEHPDMMRHYKGYCALAGKPEAV